MIAVGTLLGVIIGYWIGRGRRVRPIYLPPVGTASPTNIEIPSAAQGSVG